MRKKLHNFALEMSSLKKSAILKIFNKNNTIYIAEKTFKRFEFEFAILNTNNHNSKPPLSLFFENKELYNMFGYSSFDSYLKENYQSTSKLKKGETLIFIENQNNKNLITFEITAKIDIPIFLSDEKVGLSSFLIPLSDDKCILQSGDDLMELNFSQIKILNKALKKNYSKGYFDIINFQ